MPSGGLSERRLGVLEELGQAGIVQGAAALSQLVGEGVGLCDARLTTIVGGRISDPPENSEAGALVVMGIAGEGRGKILIAFSLPSARRLLSRLLHRPDQGLLDTEDGVSTLKETANIVGCAYLNALSEITGMLLVPTPPDLVVGSQGCNLFFTTAAEEALAVETRFFLGNLESDPILGHFYLIPDEPFVERLLLTSARHL